MTPDIERANKRGITEKKANAFTIVRPFKNDDRDERTMMTSKYTDRQIRTIFRIYT